MTSHIIAGKTVLIAGGAKNLGGLIARELADAGAKAIAIHYNSEATRVAAEETANAVRAKGAQAAIFQADLTSAAANEKLFADAEKALGKIDIAINTVGKVLKKTMIETSEAEYDDMAAINSKSAFFFLKEAGRNLNDNGKIVTIVTSLLGAFTPFYATYEGMKAPVEHFTRAASKEFGARGISVNAIGPGPMDTPFFYGEESDLLSYSGATCQRGLHESSEIRLRHPARPPCGGLRGATDFSVSGQCNMCLQQAGRKEAQE